ncbi:MAG: protoporphyrinogen oxidase [Acidithiobacillus sp.]|nr:protoporphyrinogen oxidase [Acidithiobacillus sp.]
MQDCPILIVGAGITGLALADQFQKTGKEFLLLEAAKQVGGNIQTRSHRGYLADLGPNTLLLKDPRWQSWLTELGIEQQIQVANPLARRRYIVNEHRQLIPLGPGILFHNRLLSLRARLRLLGEPLRGRGQDPDESIASFIRRRLGPEVLRWLVDPFVSGVFAGDPEQLAVAAALPRLSQLEMRYGSLLLAGLLAPKSPRAPLISFSQGLSTLPQALAQRLGSRLVCNCTVEQLEFAQDHWLVHSTQGSWRSPQLILALPAYAIAQILPPEAQELRQLLLEIMYPAVATVALGFARDQIQHPLDGFGALIPRCLGIPTLGVLFSSTLFPHRAPEGKVLLTAFLGGAQGKLPQEESGILQQVWSDLQPLLGIRGEPDLTLSQRWAHAIPQYDRGHRIRLERIQTLRKQWSGLTLLGNWQGGVALGDCLHSASECATQWTQC